VEKMGYPYLRNIYTCFLFSACWDKVIDPIWYDGSSVVNVHDGV